MRSARLGRSLPTACLVVALAFAGCGDSKNDAAATAPPTTRAAAPSTSSPVNTTFTGEGSTEICTFIASFTNRSRSVTATATPAELEASFRDSLASLEQASAVAPAEIKPDVDTIAEIFKKLEAAAAAAGFDLKKVDASALGALESPGFLQSVTRLGAYTTNVCHIPA